MAREESTALIVVGLLLILAHSCATQDPNDPRTVGLGSSVLPSSSSYLSSYGGSGSYNRLYSPYGYSGASNNYGYYGGYPPSGYAREVAITGAPVPGCQSGLLDPAKPLTSGSDHPGQHHSQIQQGSRSMSEFQTDGQTRSNNQVPSDPKAAQTISTQSSNVQQSLVQQVPTFPLQPTPIMYGTSFHHPYGMRAFSQPQVVPASHFAQPDQFLHVRAGGGMDSMAMYPMDTNKLRVVPSELHFIDPSHISARQLLPVQSRPTYDLTYNPQDMTNTYGAGNFQPPIFSLSTRQNPAFRGLQSGYQFSYPIDSRYFASGIQQQIPQRRIEHPLPVLRQSTPMDHTNQPLPPNLYRTGKWEPVTNLNIETPFNLAEYENAEFPMQGPTAYSVQGARAASSTPLCREKRETDSSWMYPFAGWSSYDSGNEQQRAATLPAQAPPLTPYHGPYAPLSEIFPSTQRLMEPGQGFPGFSNPQRKGAVEGIQHLVSGVAQMAQMVPMFSGGSPLYK